MPVVVVVVIGAADAIAIEEKKKRAVEPLAVQTFVPASYIRAATTRSSATPSPDNRKEKS